MSFLSWVLDQTLTGHNEWVRDVAWSQNIIHSKTNIASCSQVCKLIAYHRSRDVYFELFLSEIINTNGNVELKLEDLVFLKNFIC